MIIFDTQRAYIIPSETREEYFDIVDKLTTALHHHIRDAVDSTHDPIVIFNQEHISAQNFKVLDRMLKEIGAKDITDTLTMEPNETHSIQE